MLKDRFPMLRPALSVILCPLQRPSRPGPLRRFVSLLPVFGLAIFASTLSACKENSKVAPMACELDDDDDADFTQRLGCEQDFLTLSSPPLDASIPGARSLKTVLDLADEDAVYYQNTGKYLIHWEFTHAHLSGAGKPIVPELSQFNQTEYLSPDRRFVLGSLSYYDGPEVWVYEISPYDTASTDMVTRAYQKIVDTSFVGKDLYFHPTSVQVSTMAEGLPDSVRIITTEELFDGIDFQPLNTGESMGLLRIMTSKELEDTCLSFRDIVVLDAVPNDIAVTMGIVTAEFQTPLAHINVLSQNRGTPNMGLKGADKDPEIAALDGKWVRLKVTPFEYELVEVTKAEADAWWDANRPEPLGVPEMDTTVTDLQDTLTMIDFDAHDGDVRLAVKARIPVFGGKASHFGALSTIDGVNSPRAFSIPVHYYDQFMTENNFYERVDTMLADPDFESSCKLREEKLLELRTDMKNAPVNADFEQLLLTKLADDYPGTRMRFRSSTNAEDLEGFTGAGLYTSKSGDPDDPDSPVLDAIRKVWASVWFYRAFDERHFRGIDHRNVGMALLVHRSFPDEEANGVALTANPFDIGGVEPGFYINVQKDGNSVVLPDPGVTTDELIYLYDSPNQPIIWRGHSNLVGPDETVLSRAQIQKLGDALKAVHTYFYAAYGPPPGTTRWYAMDVEFKFDDDGDPNATPRLYVKQARPHPGW